MVLPAETDIADIVLMLPAEADIADMALMTDPADMADMASQCHPRQHAPTSSIDVCCWRGH